jgi:hypothetical protein
VTAVPLWVTIGGFAVPLLGLAGSAIAYVINLFSERRERRRQRFFELMQFLDDKGTIASKSAALYALRDFPEHREFIVRFCEAQSNNMTGDEIAISILKYEMLQTAEALRK